MEKGAKINCPNCGKEIDVNEILYHQLEDDIKKKHEFQLAEEKNKYESQFSSLKLEKEILEKEKIGINDQITRRVEEKLKSEEELLKKQIKEKLPEEQSEQFSLLQKELNEKSEQVKELNRSKAEIEKLKREKGELKESIEADAQRKINEKLSEEKEKIRRSERDNNELTIRALEKKLEDQKKLTEEMKRKQEQGSMQLQGEIQELAIEEWLRNSFPLDTVSEVKKGARGADCIQIVNTRTKQNCGSIYYESKRTKDFQVGWIEKFKDDIRDKGADIGVLVTDVMPSDMDRMGLINGVWICSYEEFKGLCKVLRESIIQLNNAIVSRDNKGDKMSVLYDYLTSNNFKSQIEAIVEGFSLMQTDLDNEKRAMQRIWKTREKQIEKVISNTVGMYGSIKGIAGDAIGTVKALELPGSVETEKEFSLPAPESFERGSEEIE